VKTVVVDTGEAVGSAAVSGVTAVGRAHLLFKLEKSKSVSIVLELLLLAWTDVICLCFNPVSSTWKSITQIFAYCYQYRVWCALLGNFFISFTVQ
jgi:hypothetical protein